MTSRMAFAFPGRFQSLSIQSGGFYWDPNVCHCGDADDKLACIQACEDSHIAELSEQNPSFKAALSQHPPSLFLHGANDTTVTPFLSESYLDTLKRGVQVNSSRVVDPDAGHQWISQASSLILQWVRQHAALR